MKICLGAMLVPFLFVTTIKAQNPSPSKESPLGFHLNYGEGERNTYQYTKNGCRIIGRLYSPDKAKPKKKKKSPMADMPVLKEHRVKKSKHTTVFKKVKPPKKKLKKQVTLPVASDANFDLTQAVPAGADASKPAKSFALQAKVYDNKFTELIWREEDEIYRCYVRANLLSLGLFSAFESPNNTYLFFYLPEDLRKSESAQRNRPAEPDWGKGKGVKAVLVEGDINNVEATEPIAALLEIFQTHKKDLKQIYKQYKKRQKELAKRPKEKEPESTQETIHYSISTVSE